MTKLNNKGFAVSTILYGILALTILILMLIFGIMRASKDMNQDLASSIEEDINDCVLSEVNLENCYYNGGSCVAERYEYNACINRDSTLVDQILVDNIAYADNVSSPNVSSSTGINFGAISSDTNGKGLYYTSTNTEDTKTTYYFRGAVENNYAKFAEQIWRIVRINEDGSVRLIKQSPLRTSSFNSTTDDNAYVGYMYGTVGSSTYSDTHNNQYQSSIKSILDEWYKKNLIEYSEYIADSGFCNDRSIASGAKTWHTLDTALGYDKNTTYYGTYNRLNNLKSAQFACPNASNDLFTTSTSGKGNKKLEYPIGLLTADEVVYAGGVSSSNNTSYYLNINKNFWTMSPNSYIGSSSTLNVDIAYEWLVDSNGKLTTHGVIAISNSILPVINLKSTVQITGGDGTELNPYVILTS